MALDPRISLGVQPMQMPDPLAQYGKIAAIQQAQNQNALAQYQLSAAQREEEKTNALSNAYKEAYDPKTGAIDTNRLRQSLATGGFGAQLPAVEKALGELETQKLTRQKTEGELVKQRMETSRELLSTVRTPEEYIAWHEANHADPVLGKYLAGRGITADQARAQIVQQLQQPGGFETLLRNSALGLEKSMKQHFVTQNLGGSTQVMAMPEYQVPGAPSKAAVVPGSVQQMTMAPGEAERIAISRGQLGVAQAGLVLRQQELAQQRDPEFQQRMAYGKAMGEAAAKGDIAAKQEFPKVVAQAQEAVGLIDQMIGQRDAKGNLVKGAAPHPGFTGSVGAGLGLRFVPGTSEANFQALYDQVKSGAFLQAFNALRGAGAITEKEGEKATAAITRMSLAQDEKEFVKAALEFQDSVKAGAERAQQKVLGAGGGTRPSAPATPPSARPSISPNIDALLDKYK